MLVALIFAAFMVMFLGGMYLGYEIGVSETERRWSEAIAKGDYAREHQS